MTGSMLVTIENDDENTFVHKYTNHLQVEINHASCKC